MTRPPVILDDAGQGRLSVFDVRRAAIRADSPQEVPAALEALQRALAAGNFLAGYFSYELGYVLEPKLLPLLPSARSVPLLWFGVFDAPTHIEGEGVGAALDGWQQGRAYAGPLQHEWDGEAYQARFDRIRALIAAGDFYQANLTFRSRFAFAGDPLTLYCRLRGQSQARYGAFVDDGERQILSLSPELFFELSADRRIVARPMKGTAARGVDAVADVLVRETLAQSTKNRAENLMIVDLLRNDLGRIAETGSVGVPGLFAVETYPTLHQMVSTVSARLKPGTSVEAVVRALFPCGSITGAPKIHAMELIAGLEQSPRGVYCGAIGHFAPDGLARFNVAIRTLTISGARGELGIGGGIVQDSEVESEYEEALLKARYYVGARRPLELIETLRWSPGEGFVRLDLHLSRMAHSASAFAMPFDPGRARAALEEAVDGCTEAQRVRLTLGDSGAFACTAAALGETPEVWRFAVSPQRVLSTDLLARHKTNWRELYESGFSHRASGADEVVFLNERGELVEGSRSNIFVQRDGKLLTPPLSAGVLDGVLRRALIADGRCREATLTLDDLRGAEVYLGNSLRGLIRAQSV